ncbi:MAG: oxidoreductase [Stappia sp.]|uniref:SDR family NAD(P)-dependent oxidoreductase n=1 Tax=Stappia sp. TaxID=1870903 RepID=UPI000C41FB9E|nr:SDR family NAD(P)-dependent oxidoreductase [Stappia sp.]MAA98580.1 oxidoreductase [Stappia sp.]MBM20591.1 oxidoreductase [Stappia sp.]
MSAGGNAREAVRPEEGIAWITGASSGIGAALAETLARDGWRVAATARSAEALADLEARSAAWAGDIRAFSGDVTDPVEMTRIVRRIEMDYGPLVMAVLNAGVYLPVDGTAPRHEDFHASIDVNLKGTVNTMLPAMEAMRLRRRGQIAVVASVAGYRGLPTSAAYGATKAGLINLAEAMKFDLDRLGIAIQVISPGFVDTPATRDNPFPMPDLMPVEDAAAALAAGLKRPERFEISFPRSFTRKLKLLRLLPYRLYFPLVARATGWSGKGSV